ncbi:Co2+/Mg2+ efflux protein ApaG [Tenacibaculum sp. IB213877]|uniref:Co2+/Mg2+ efflux protein ApaG n=1 Tax=Tenacibaculum sp. IB213877 TaxID=3097351 RepID=UPI002A5A621F|nr:Co2+/Mg2+ efflux protein ApaG [Tenacibaculum sp. IB213877]MDY0781587.1 Co2+/Mg2+ efflux protein ApaG [Tenacibaculum sp. IB213877]
MFQQITKGIKISVKSLYNGIVARDRLNYHAFSYFVSIENNSKDPVQLLERYWTILDSLNITEYVEGKGVVGETPIILPKEKYNYRSNCFLRSSTGAMLGNYKMLNLTTNEEFLVTIPTFQLTTTTTLN